MHIRRIHRAAIVATGLLAAAVLCRAAFLDGTKCKVTLVPEKEAADKGEKKFSDTLTFADDKFTSTALLAKGFKPAPYRGEKEPNEAEFEVEQTSDTGDVVNWQGEIRGKKVVGRLRWTRKDGTHLAYEFEGTTE